MGWIDLAQDRDQWRAPVKTVMNLLVPQNVGKFLSGCAIGGFPRMTQLHGVSSYCWLKGIVNNVNYQATISDGLVLILYFLFM
jgi:hypothetical protein